MQSQFHLYRRFQSVTLFFLTIFFVSSCTFQDVKILKVEDVNITSFQKSEIKGEIVLQIENPNRFAVTVSSADFEILKGGRKLGEAHLDDSFRISGTSTKSYPIKLTGDMSGALAGGISGLLGFISGNNPKVTLKGEVQAKSFFIHRSVPVDLETELPISGLVR